jgi:hypothetical protein
VSVAALSFAVGVICSLFIYIGRSLHRRVKRGLADRDRDLAEREKAIAHRQAGSRQASNALPEPEIPRKGGRQGVADEPDIPRKKDRTVLEKIRDFFVYRP